MTARSVYTLGLEYLLAQVAVKSVSMLSAIFVVRWLAVEDYAFYTILLAGYTLLVVLSDLGLSGSLSYFMSNRGGPPFSQYVQAAANLRRWFFTVAAALTGLGLWLAVEELQFAGPQRVMPVLMVLFAGWFGVQWISSSFILRLHHRFRAVYSLELMGESIKLVFIATWVRSVPSVDNSLLAILLGVSASALASGLALRVFHDEQSKSSNRRLRREVFQQVLPRAPSVVYFALSQIVLVPALAAAFAPSLVLAEVGALGRISVVLLVAGGFLSQVVTPLLVRAENESLFWAKGVRWLGGLLAGCIGLSAVCWWFPDQVLWILGGPYRHLHFELFLGVVGAGITLLGSFLWELNRTRGLVRHQYWEVPVAAMGLLAACFAFDLSTTSGLLMVIICGGLGTLFFQFTVAGLRIYQVRRGVGVLG